MEKNKEIHLERPNTLADFLTEEERKEVVSLKISGVMGRRDFEDVLDDLCNSEGYHDVDDNYIPDYELAAPLRHLDLGEATYVDGDCLPYFGYVAQQETLILPKGIRTTLDGDELGTGFNESEMLKKLVLPDGLKIVGGFDSCENLSGVILPEGLEEIKSYAFAGCKAISSVRIPASVKVMDGSCFAGCNIKEYVVDENNPCFTVVDGVIYNKDLTKLIAFPSYYPNKHFSVPSTVRIIGYSSFEDSHIESIELPDGLITIERNAFSFSIIKSVTIPDSVTEIGELAFRFCMGLEQVKLPEGIQNIYELTFSGCLKLKSICIPASVVKIDSFALSSQNLMSVVMEGDVPPELCIDDRNGMSIPEGVEIYVPKGAIQTYKDAHGWNIYTIKEITDYEDR